MRDESHSATASSVEASPVTLRGYYEGRTPLKRLFSPVGSTPADGHDQARIHGLLDELGGFDPDLRKTVKLASARANPPRWLQAWLKSVVERERGGGAQPGRSEYELRIAPALQTMPREPTREGFSHAPSAPGNGNRG